MVSLMLMCGMLMMSLVLMCETVCSGVEWKEDWSLYGNAVKFFSWCINVECEMYELDSV